MFTMNSLHTIYFFPFLRRIARRIYDRTHAPLPFCIGCFPVKLITYIGEPIEYDPNRTVDELRNLAKQRIESMISKYQEFPKSFWQAFLDRFRHTSMKQN